MHNYEEVARTIKERALNELGGVESGDSIECRCPVHEDQNPSLSITEDRDKGGIALYCHAGCSVQHIAGWFGFSVGELFANRRTGRTEPLVVATYRYTGPDGEILYEVRRTEDKQFHCWRPHPTHPDQWVCGVSGGRYYDAGGGVWRKPSKTYDGPTEHLPAVERALYNLYPCDGKTPLLWLEGEKDCETAKAFKSLHPITHAGGAFKKKGESKFNKDWLGLLRGATVYVVQDFDEAGFRSRRALAEMLRESCTVKILQDPPCETGKDLTDFVETLGPDLVERWVLESAVDYSTYEAQEETKQQEYAKKQQEAFCRTMGLEPIGVTQDGEMQLYSHFRQRVYRSKRNSTRSWLRDDFVAMCGRTVTSRSIVPDEMKTEDNQWSLREACEILVNACHDRELDDENCKGQGIWPTSTGIVLVNHRQAHHLNGHGLEDLVVPVHDEQVFMVGQDARPWMDPAKIRTDLDRPNRAARQLVDFFRLWTWRQRYAPEILTGLAIASWGQAVWPHRPQVAIIGESQSGKTTLFEKLDEMYCGLSVKRDQPSDAAIRQEIGQSARIVLIDEFEKSKNRKQILRMARTATKGGVLSRGTTGHRVQLFRLYNLFWFGAIESGVMEEADANRFIVLNTTKPAGNDGKLDDAVPGLEAMQKMGHESLVCFLQNWRAVLETMRQIVTTKPSSVSVRTANLYALPVAMYGAASGLDDQQLADLYGEILSLREDPLEHMGTDEEQLISDILSSTGRVNGHNVSFEVLLRKAYREPVEEFPDVLSVQSEAVLASCFATRIFNEDVFLAHRTFVDSGVLRNSRWRDSRIDEILLRIPGVERKEAKIKHVKYRGLLIKRHVFFPESSEDLL